MEKSDFEEFSDLWVATCEMCNGKTPSEMVVSLAFDDLKAYTLPEVWQALKKHRLHPDTGKYWPQSQTIINSIVGGGDLVSQKAWKKVYHALRCIGPNDDIRFEDPMIMQAVEDLGGWQVLLDCDEETIGYKEHDFKRTYRAYSTSGLKDDPPEVFRGLENMQRLNAGEELKKFPSYEQRLHKSKTSPEVKTLPRPIDEVRQSLDNLNRTQKEIMADIHKILGSVKPSE